MPERPGRLRDRNSWPLRSLYQPFLSAVYVLFLLLLPLALHLIDVLAVTVVAEAVAGADLVGGQVLDAGMALGREALGAGLGRQFRSC